MGYHPQRSCQVKPFMRRRVLLKVRFRQLEQGKGWPEPVLLQMHKRPGQLDEPFVIRPVGTLSLRQPNPFQDFVGLKVLLPIKARNKAQVMGIYVLAPEFVNDGCDLIVLLAHGLSLDS
jgi:hypothetical protein